MPRAVLLQCPICKSIIAFAGTRDDHSNEELRARAKDHLKDHHINENKIGIRKHQIAAEVEEIIVSAADFDRLTRDEWQHPSNTWLPDGITSAGAIGDRLDGADEISSTHYHAQD